jgi:2-phospho-L-lactate/phosphoenolpyruvate guanylyltransferase
MLFALVPVKPFLESKSRLANSLSPDERAELSRGLLTHTLQVLANVPEIAQTLVVSRDPAALALARDYRAQAISETGAGELNAALTQATQVARAAGAASLLILPSDLPLLSIGSIQQLIAESEDESFIAIAPDRHEDGTNALLVHPPNLIPYAFGEHSFQRHIAQAQQAGALVRICRLPALALDVDTPEDLDHLTSLSSVVSRPKT